MVVKCPGCQRSLKITEATYGKVIKCPCGKTLKAPAKPKQVSTPAGKTTQPIRPAGKRLVPSPVITPVDSLLDDLTENDFVHVATGSHLDVNALPNQSGNSLVNSELASASAELAGKKQSVESGKGHAILMRCIYGMMAVVGIPIVIYIGYGFISGTGDFFAGWSKKVNETTVTMNEKAVGADTQKPFDFKQRGREEFFEPAKLAELKASFEAKTNKILQEVFARENEQRKNRGESEISRRFLSWVTGWPAGLQVGEMVFRVTENNHIEAKFYIHGEPLDEELDMACFVTDPDFVTWKKSEDNATLGSTRNNLLRKTIVDEIVVKMQRMNGVTGIQRDLVSGSGESEKVEGGSGN